MFKPIPISLPSKEDEIQMVVSQKKRKEVENRLEKQIEFMTLTRFVADEQRKIGVAGEFPMLLTSIQSVVKTMSAIIRKAGFAPTLRTGLAADVFTNLIDQRCDAMFINTLSSSFSVYLLATERNADVITIDPAVQGSYVVLIEPMEGKANLESHASIACVFSVYKAKRERLLDKEVLQKGTEMVSAGYVLFGSSTILVLALNGVVSLFMMDPALGEFLLLETHHQIPREGNLYCCNEGFSVTWDPGVLSYIADIKKVNSTVCRHVGCVVADFHRVLFNGGIMLIPPDKGAHYGRVKLQFVANALAYIMETAGGKASNGTIDISEVVPESLHQKTPFYAGSVRNMRALLSKIRQPT